MRDVGVVAFAQSPCIAATTLTPVEMIVPVITEVLATAGLDRRDVGFWCHGSCDYMVGQPFSFVSAVDALGAWPPIVESHVEMDGAWALYEAWLKMQSGECDIAVVFGNGKASAGDYHRYMAVQLDPYVVGPLWPDARAIAAMQARACLDAGTFTERDMAEVVSRSRVAAVTNPRALARDPLTVDQVLATATTFDPLRELDCPAMADGVSAVVIAAGDAARRLNARPAWIRSLHHIIDSQRLGTRDATVSASTTAAAALAEVTADKVDVAELHAPFSHQELIIATALGLPAGTVINPSGGALVGNPPMAAGLARLGEAALRIHDGSADRVVGHATQGPWLQQNLVCVMEGE